MANRLQEKYKNEVVPSMIEKFNYSSIMQAPKLDKIVINMGVGDAVSNAKNLENAVEELTLIAGQKPVITTAKKSDRKSTRLNSSHVSISYAVFCLKKKK